MISGANLWIMLLKLSILLMTPLIFDWNMDNWAREFVFRLLRIGLLGFFIVLLCWYVVVDVIEELRSPWCERVDLKNVTSQGLVKVRSLEVFQFQ